MACLILKCDRSRTWGFYLKRAGRNRQPGMTSQFSILKATFPRYLSPETPLILERGQKKILCKKMTLEALTFHWRPCGRIPQHGVSGLSFWQLVQSISPKPLAPSCCYNRLGSMGNLILGPLVQVIKSDSDRH